MSREEKMHNYGEKIYLGLDLGTNSVGWAVTDENYSLRRAKGKDLWGARLFDAAQPSVERRSHRTSRRREQREKARVSMLQSYFEEEITRMRSHILQLRNLLKVNEPVGKKMDFLIQ